MESPTGLSQAPLKHYFPTFHCGTSSFCCLPIFSSLESEFDNNHKIVVPDYVMTTLCIKILAYVTYVGKYQKAYIRHHNFYLGIFHTIFPKLVLFI